MIRVLHCRVLIPTLLLASLAGTALAARPAADLLPASTKGYLALNNMPQLMGAWQETELGQLFQDPAMQPLWDDLVPQLREQAGATNKRFAVTWEDLQALAAQEVCLAIVEPEQRGSHALVLLLDATGRPAEARKLLHAIHARMLERKAAYSAPKFDGLPVNAYRLPAAHNQIAGHTAYVVLYKEQLLIADHPAILEGMIQRWRGKGSGALSSTRGFQETLARTQLGSDDEITPAHVQWFVEPLGLARTIRAANRGAQKRGMDLLKVLENQGFDAIEGIGGQVALRTDKHELLHRSFVYLGKEPQLAARMLSFPNGPELSPPSWIPDNIASYVSLRWNMAQAFEHSKSLVNELAGEAFFEEFLRNLESDPNGPQINLRRDLIQHLGENITLISDCRRPISPESDRFLCAIEIRDTAAVAHTINQAFQSDPSARRHTHQGHAIWEIMPPDEHDELIVTVEIQGAGFDFGGAEEEPAEEAAPSLPRSAITVVDGRLIISSHVDYIIEVLQTVRAPQLSQANDFQRVTNALRELGASQESFRIFSRSDETYYATYELLREGRLSESQSMLAQMLRRVQGDDGAKRQTIDGSRLPDFEIVRKYLGPAGVYVESYPNGWSITGCLLSRAE